MKTVLGVLGLIFIVISAAFMFQNGKERQQSAHHHPVVVDKSDDVRSEFSFSPEIVQAGQEAAFSIWLTDKNQTPIESFDVVHEKKLHLIAVSKDLSYFDHIHPDFKGKGLFAMTTRFPFGGDYKLFADFTPTGQGQMTKSQWVSVLGNQQKPQAAPIIPDKQLVKVVEGKEVQLSFDHLMANMDLGMVFSIKDANTKAPITNLQPYLGETGHVVIVSQDAESYIHVHPSGEKTTGPNARFTVSFPKPGIYKIWGQFQQEGKVFVVPFVIKVP